MSSSGKGGVSLPEIPENEAAKWTQFYSKKLPGTVDDQGPKAPLNTATAPSKKDNNNDQKQKQTLHQKGSNATNNKTNPAMSVDATAKAVQEDVAAAEAAFDQGARYGRRKHHQHQDLHRGKKRTEADSKESPAEKEARLAKAAAEEERRKQQREEIEARKKERQAENRKGQSEFRAMQLALVTPEDIHQYLKTSLFATTNNNKNNRLQQQTNQDDEDTDQQQRNRNNKNKNRGEKRQVDNSNSFSDPKHLGIFMQALLANSSSPKQNKTQSTTTTTPTENAENAAAAASATVDNEESKNDDDQESSLASSRPVVLRDFINNKQSKPFVWSLLALVHSIARRAAGFLATSPCTLKFVGLCDSFGVATDDWSSDVSTNPFSIDASTTWQPPALAPNALIRQIEEKAWYEYLSARVESLFSAQEVVKFCSRVTQQRHSPAVMRSSNAKDNSKNNTSEDLLLQQQQQNQQEDGVINVLIPPTKLALLASKFASKLLRSKSLFVVVSAADDDDNSSSSNMQTTIVSSCIDCLDFLTHSQKELTTLKKVSLACRMMLGVLGVEAPASQEEEDSDSSSSSSDDDDKEEQSDKKQQPRVVPEELKDLVDRIDAVSLRCQGGATEDEVALASARQLMAVAKFKAAETANGISRIIDEIVEDDERPANERERVTVQGDDVLSAMAVAVNTLLGPPKRIVQFSDALLEDAAAAAQQQQRKQNSKNDKKNRDKNGSNNNNNNNTKPTTAPVAQRVIRKTREEEEMDAELEAEMRGTTTKKDSAVDADDADADNDKNKDAEVPMQQQLAKKTVAKEDAEDDENVKLQKRVMALLEMELSQGRPLPRRAQTFLDRCRQELRRRQRDE